MDHDLLELGLESFEHHAHQVVGKRARNLCSFQRQRNRRRLERTNQNRKVTATFEILKDDDGIVCQQIDPEFVNLHLTHLF